MKKLFYVLILSLFVINGFSQSYFEDFAGGSVPSGISGGSNYIPSIDNGELKVLIRKNDMFSGLYFGFPSALNLSALANRVVSLDIRTDTLSRIAPFVIGVQFFQVGGTIYTGIVENRLIHVTNQSRTVTFSFANSRDFGAVDWSQIIGFQIVFAPLSVMDANVWLDNVRVGTGTVHRPFYKGVERQEMYINSPTRTAKVEFAIDATLNKFPVTFSAVSSNPSIVPNPVFVNSPITSNDYFPFNSACCGTPQLMSNLPVRMNITPAANQYGMATITVTATTTNTVAGVTLGPSISTFDVIVRRNSAPQIGTYPINPIIGSNITTTFTLSNINSGNPETTQNMTITGVSSDQTVIPNSGIVVTYDGIGQVAGLRLTPTAFGVLPSKSTNITLTITDNGGTAAGGVNQSQIVLTVTVFPQKYNEPTIDAIPGRFTVRTAGPQTITLTGITDGNGGSNIASVTAQSSNTAIMLNPTMNYQPGNNYAFLTYNIPNLGMVFVSVTASNLGAPANSNGNSSYTRVFTIVGIDPPVNGYTESFTSTTVIGADYYVNSASYTDWQHNNQIVKWYSEGQGAGNAFTTVINSVTGTATITTNKTNGYDGGRWFAGLWWKPVAGGTYNFAQYPYLSVRLSSTWSQGTPSVAIDLFDINDNRYGLSSYRTINGTSTVYTFCYNGIPSDADFDFSKVQRILFNVPAIDAGIFANFVGSVNISELRIGDQAVGTGTCPPNAFTTVTIDTVGNRPYLTNNSGPKTVTVTGITAGSSPITGPNNNTVSVSLLYSGGTIVPSIGPVVNGRAIISFNTPASVTTTTITVVGTATAAYTSSKIFQVQVTAPPGTSNAGTITNNTASNMPDGYPGQNIDGFGVTLNGNVGDGGGPDSYHPANPLAIGAIKDAGWSMCRMAIPVNFEYRNDNDDPFVFNWDGFDFNSLRIDQYMKYKEAGVERFIGTLWSIQNWAKYNRDDLVPSAGQGFVGTNTLDSNYVQEVAEFCTAYVLMLKQHTGIEMYALDFVNEPQFNEPYASAVINPDQYVILAKAIINRFNQYGIKTLLFGPETLGQDNGIYINTIAADPFLRNNFSAHARHNYAPDGVGAGELTWNNILLQSRNTNLNGGFTRYQANPQSPAGSNGNGGPGIPVWQTETSGQAANWNGAFSYAAAIHNGLTGGNVSAWTYWTWDDGNPNGSYGLFGGSTIKPIYYTKKHYSKYIRPGARRVPANISTASGVYMTAFQNPDASLAVVLINNNTTWTQVNLSGTNLPSSFRAFQSYQSVYWNELNTTSGATIYLPAKSVTTLWGGGNATVSASSVSVSGHMMTTVITSPGGTLQMNATVFPSNVPDKTVTWSVITLTGRASVNASGLLMGHANGTVRVRATSNNTPSVFGELVITISGQYQPVLGMTVNGTGGIRTITTVSGSLQMVGIFNPSNATNQLINWSIIPSSGLASINASGLLSAIANGLVTVTGISQENATITSRVVVTITGQPQAVTSATVDGTGGIRTINTPSGTLQMVATYSPADATSTTVGWTVNAPGGIASINPTTGLLSASNSGNGLVTVTGTYSTWGVSAVRIVTITGQSVIATGLTIVGQGGVNTINTPGGNLQMIGIFAPAGVTNTTLGWTFVPATTVASINASGIVSALNNGICTISGTTQDGSSITRYFVITVTGQSQIVTSATINGTGGVSQINTAGGTLQMLYSYNPANANTNTLPGWNSSNSAIGSINSSGLITAVNNGIITITGSFGSVNAISIITITGQPILVTSATVNGVGGVRIINTAGGTLQIIGTYSPANANTNTLVGWSLTDPTGQNSINAAGLLQANTNGNGIVTVTGTYGGGIIARVTITISGQNIPVTSATVNGLGGVRVINTANGTLQMIGTYSPPNANTNTLVGWSLIDPTGQNSINAAGLLQAATNGNAIVTVTGTYGGGITARVTVTITGQNIPVTSATVIGTGGITTINTSGGTLQMLGNYSPANANINTLVGWSIVPSTGIASINASTGLLSAINNGLVTVIGLYGAVSASRVITITGQPVLVSSATVNGLGGINEITSAGTSLQMTVSYSPANANTNTLPGWSILPSAGVANINASSGLLTPIINGVVTVTATLGAVTASRVVNISGQPSAITLSSSSQLISIDLATMQIFANFTPSASSVTGTQWSLQGTGGTISGSGLLQALTNGVVTVTGRSSQNNAIFGTRIVTITGQAASFVQVTSVSITGGNSISTPGGTLVLNSLVLPGTATNPAINWFANPSSGVVSLNPSSSTVTLTGQGNGIVTITGVSASNPTVSGVRIVTVSGYPIPVTAATVNGVGGVRVINTANGTLQMTSVYSPTNANTNTLIGWSLIDPSGQNSINASGLLQSNTNGNGIITVTGTYGGGIIASVAVTISGQNIPVTSATVIGTGGVATINTAGGTLQMIGSYNPSNANTNTLVGWSIFPSSGTASINASTGLLTAINNGLVTVTGQYGGITATRVITITGQAVAVTSATVDGVGGVRQITTGGGTLQMIGNYSPTNANTNTLVGWSINGGIASINASGLITANNSGNGIVTVSGTYGGVIAHRVITISGQFVGISVASSTVDGVGGVRSINTAGGSLQMISNYSPANANTFTLVGWSIVSNPSGIANINPTSGLLLSLNSGNGLVTVTGTYGNGVFATRVVTITGQTVLATGLTISGTGGSTSISISGGQLQMLSTLSPSGVTNTTVGWSLIPSSGVASINPQGLLTAISNGIVTVVGTTQDGTGINAYRIITISGQFVSTPVTSATIDGTGGVSSISTFGGQLQMIYSYSPANANVNTSPGWSVSPGTVGQISGGGLVTALNNGVLTVTATFGSVIATKVITITNQSTLVTSVGVNVQGGGAAIIATGGGTLQMTVTVEPTGATNQNVSWSLIQTGSIAGINPVTGNIIANNAGNGVITVVATALDGSNVWGYTLVTISGQNIPVQGLNISGNGGINYININGGGLQMVGNFTPANATNTNITWSIIDPTGLATAINATGFFNAANNENGTVTIIGVSQDGGFTASQVITITGQRIKLLNVTLFTPNPFINVDKGSITITPILTPVNTTEASSIVFSVSNTAIATIDPTGYLTAIDNGIITVTAISTANATITSSIVISVSGQLISNILITNAGTNYSITSTGGSLQLQSITYPPNAINNQIIWSVIPSSIAGINSSGLLTANDFGNGTVTVTAYNVASNRFDTIKVMISGQRVPVQGLSINAASSITTILGTVHLIPVFVPSKPTNTLVGWTIVNTTKPNIATITGDGILKALDGGNGTVTIMGASVSDPTIVAYKVVNISGQSTSMISYIVVDGPNTIFETPSQILVGNTYYLLLNLKNSLGEIQSVVGVSGNLDIVNNYLPQFTDKFIYTSNSPDLTVNTDGSFSASNFGEFTVTVSYKPDTAIKITIPINIEVTSISIVIYDANNMNTTVANNALIVSKDYVAKFVSDPPLDFDTYKSNFDWKASNLRVLSMDFSTGYFSTVGVGTSNISITGKGAFKRLKAEATVTVSNTNSLISEANGQVALYPVPAKDIVHIIMTEATLIQNISLINASGNIVLTEYPNTTVSKYELNIKELPTGIYMINVYTDNHIHTVKLIKE
ncbi:MAG: Ig-like domain-containing protein [Cytophagales bacterium]|nr:Ig-like domain-containing protein [Cytophagales bacterium]